MTQPQTNRHGTGYLPPTGNRRSKQLSVAVVTGRFPAISETFVLNQIMGLIDRGIDVEIFAVARDEAEFGLEDFDHARLLEHTRYAPATPTHAMRPTTALRRAFKHGPGGLRLLTQTLSRRRFGRRAWTLRPFFEALPWLDTPPYDVVIAQYGPIGASMAALREIGLWSGPLITFFRGHDATRLPREAPGCYDRLFQVGDLFLAVSEDLQRKLIGLGCPQDRLRVHRSGIDLSKFNCRNVPDCAPRDPTCVLSIGRLVDMKGFAGAIDTVATVIERGRSVHYRIIGDGPLRSPLINQVHRLGLQRHVELLDWQGPASVRRHLADAHILLAPSVTTADGNTEGVPNVIKEAMACGRPVIATDHGGIGEVVVDGASGRLIPEYDVQSMASALIDLMDHPQQWREMGQAGRRIVAQKFDRERLNDELVQIIRNLVETNLDLPLS